MHSSELAATGSESRIDTSVPHTRHAVMTTLAVIFDPSIGKFNGVGLLEVDPSI